MSERGLLLVLEGPLQSWGTQGRFGHRDTDFEPSKSGVIGLLGASLGMPRDDEAMLARLASLSMAVRVDGEGRVLRDYHTVGGGTYRGMPHSVFGAKETVLTSRHYLMDACFVVAISGNDHQLIDRLAEAVRNPLWPLFLGRKSCTPTRSVYLAGPVDGSAEKLLAEAPWQATVRNPSATRLRCVVEGDDGKPRADTPRSFRLYERRFDTRFVKEKWILIADLPGENHVSESPAAESTLA